MTRKFTETTEPRGGEADVGPGSGSGAGGGSRAGSPPGALSGSVEAAEEEAGALPFPFEPPPEGPPEARGPGRWATAGLFVLAILYTLHLAKALVLPLVLGVLLSFVLAPPVTLLRRMRIPSAVASGVVVVSLVAALAGSAYALSGPAGRWLAAAPQNLEELETRIRDYMEPVAQVGDAADQVEEMTRVGDEESGRQTVRVEGSGLRDTLFSRTREVLTGIFITVLLAYFLLSYSDVLMRNLVGAFFTGPGKEKRALELARDIQTDVSTYLFTITVINVVLGALVAGAMAYLGMPNPLLWGAVGGLLNYVPYLGALVGTGILTMVALGTFEGAGMALLVGAFYFVLTSLEGTLIRPLVLGKRLTLNPLAVFVGLIFWGWLWGIPGALLAVPILAVMKGVADHHPALAPLGAFLGR